MTDVQQYPAKKKGFNKDSVAGTLVVAFFVCLVCAVVVAGTSVTLREKQAENLENDRKKNILSAAGLYDPSQTVKAQFANVTSALIDLRTGEYSNKFNPESFNSMKASKVVGDSSSSFADLGTEDIAKIGRRENYATVYLIKDEDGQLEKIILPIRGYGLWSTLLGFIALEKDTSTVSGIGFYSHKETPGLGGEVDNADWKAIWIKKQIYSEGRVALSVIKGSVNPADKQADYKIDGLAGATLTSKGVDNLIKFWLGEQGFGPYLAKLKRGV